MTMTQNHPWPMLRITNSDRGTHAHASDRWGCKAGAPLDALLLRLEERD